MYKKLFLNKKAVLFGLDNVLSPITEHLISGVRSVQIKHGAATFLVRELVAQGYSLKDIWEEIKRDKDIDLKEHVDTLVQESVVEIVKELTQDSLDPVEGFYALAAELKIDRQLRLGLATSLEKAVVDKVLDSLDLTDVFDTAVTAEDSGMFFNPYKKALENLKLNRKDAVAFENTLLGAQFAHDAKLDLVIVGQRSFEESEYPNEVIEFVDNYSTFVGQTDIDPLELLKERANQLQQETNLP